MAQCESDNESELEPLSLALAAFNRFHDTNIVPDRLWAFKTAVENWTQFQQWYRVNLYFCDTLSPAQQASFHFVYDWRTSRYSSNGDVDDFREKLEAFSESIALMGKDLRHHAFPWISNSVYHSTCLELFCREFYPSVWESWARQEPLAELAIHRNYAIYD